MKSFFLSFVTLAVSACTIVETVETATYSRTDSLTGKSFLDAFYWQATPDLTWGRVNYVNQSTATKDGLYSVSGDTVTLRADDTTVLSATGPGRNSFRLMSNNQYSRHVAIFDISHMPEGCGTWPAVWSVSYLHMFTKCHSHIILVVYREVADDWPNGGEIDIVEGVNNETPNQSTLHTTAGCTMPSSRNMTGTSASTDCDVYTTGNDGCGVKLDDKNSFGPDFNANGGGWYAIERSSTHIAVYFWERGSSSVPSEVRSPGNTVHTSTWGMPAAYFPDTDCDFPSHFKPMNIIINLTFCGAWAGAVYSQDGCPSNCVDYVNNKPTEFSNAYFEFKALTIYQ